MYEDQIKSYLEGWHFMYIKSGVFSKDLWFCALGTLHHNTGKLLTESEIRALAKNRNNDIPNG